MKTIYNTYVVMESQEQCDRMKQLCIDNNLPTWRFFNFQSECLFAMDNGFHFYVMRAMQNILKYRNKNIQVNEQEFIKLLKSTKL